jgi:hypothetical protein
MTRSVSPGLLDFVLLVKPLWKHSRIQPLFLHHLCGYTFCQHNIAWKFPDETFSFLYANAGNQSPRYHLRLVMASPNHAEHLLHITFPAIRIEPLMIAAAINDSGDLGQMIFRAITAGKVNIKLDPYLTRLPKTKHGAEACR